jgi:CRISPR system Cascade subunit CasD
MKALIIRLDAPMMSFGSVMVDQHGYIDRFPGIAMLTGLIANALGWEHSHFDRLEKLQSRLKYAARWDVRPERMVDYHTVDLGQSKMREPGWTTRGRPEHRSGAKSTREGTHQRYRHYWTDGLMTVALTLEGDVPPDLMTVCDALRRPARPLFIGRKTCLPARPILDPETPIAAGENLLGILRQVPVWDRKGNKQDREDSLMACWPMELRVTDRDIIRRVFDLRDWFNDIPTGSRWRAEGMLQVVENSKGGGNINVIHG